MINKRILLGMRKGSLLAIGLWLSACGTILGVGDEDDFRIVSGTPATEISSSSSSGNPNPSGGGTGGQGGGSTVSGVGRLECVRSVQLPADTKSLTVTGAAINEAGAVVLTGHFNNLINLGGMPLISNGIQDVFIVKYSFLLEHLWSRAIGSNKKDEGGPVLATADHIYVGGSFSGDSILLDTSFIDDAGQNDGTADPFVVSLLSSTGASQWIHNCGEVPFNSSGTCTNLTVDPAGNIYSTALMNNKTYAATQTLRPDGAELNVPSFISSASSLDSAHAVWFNNSLFRAGAYNLSIDFDGLNSCQMLVNTQSFLDIYLSKQPASCFGCGDCLNQSFSFTGGDTYAQQLAQMDVDTGAASGDPGILLAGTLQGSIDEWGGAEFTSAGEGDAFMIKLDPNTGGKRWSRMFGDGQMQEAKALSVFGKHVALAGDFFGQIDFSADQSLPFTAIQRDMFFGVFDTLTAETKLGMFWENPGNQSVIAMDINSLGEMVLVGSFSGTADFGCESGQLQSIGNFPNVFVATFRYKE